MRTSKEHGIEAVIWIAVTGRALSRAPLAAGIGTAFADANLCVTLLEVGAGLPNVGFYFALQPEEYLKPVLDQTSIVEGVAEKSIRFMYARSAGALDGFRPRFGPPTFPHVILLAVSSSGPVSCVETLRRLCEDVRPLPGTGSLGIDAPDGAVVFGDADSAAEWDCVMQHARKRNPQAALYLVGPPDAGTGGERIDEHLALPRDLTERWGHPMPASGPFFESLTTSILQLISSRRRRCAGRAVG
ncbi:MAG: hypothetical protein JSV33_01100 [bacterium]|nr:MAG: hypothetical protein JSV33_01100 [bacterium]